MKTIPNSMAVFCLATYGEGDPTDNAMEFVDWLKNGEGDLTGLNYAVSARQAVSVVEHKILKKKKTISCRFKNVGA